MNDKSSFYPFSVPVNAVEYLQDKFLFSLMLEQL